MADVGHWIKAHLVKSTLLLAAAQKPWWPFLYPTFLPPLQQAAELRTCKLLSTLTAGCKGREIAVEHNTVCKNCAATALPLRAAFFLSTNCSQRVPIPAHTWEQSPQR